MGNEIYNSTTMQIYGCGFNVIFAGNLLKHMCLLNTPINLPCAFGPACWIPTLNDIGRSRYVTEKCIGSSGLSIYSGEYVHTTKATICT